MSGLIEMRGSYLFEKLLDTFQLQQSQINDRIWSQGNALSNWLIVGNAGALVLALNAHATRAICDPAVLRFSALCFAAGLVLTFFGLVIGYFGSLWMSMKLASLGNHIQGAWIAQTFVDKLEEDGIDVPDDAPLNQTIGQHQAALEAGQRRLKRGFVVAGIASAFVACGALLFSVGVLRPLAAGNPFAGCANASASATSDGNAAEGLTR